MRLEITVPNLPESINDATLLDWHKRPGDRLLRGENLIDLETDKVILEVPVPENGVLLDVRRNRGEVVLGGDLLAIMETSEEHSLPTTPAPPVTASVEQPAPTVGPSARRMLMEHQINPAEISGTGREGRVTRQDVHTYLNRQPISQATTDEAASHTGERRVPMTRLRARIAERLMEAQRNTATLTTFNEVNLQKIFELRNQYRTRFEQEHATKLGFMSFFVKATVAALKRFPIVNASIDGDEIVYHDYYDIGIAVSSERGLVVPILRQADQLDFGTIERAIAEFSKKARDGKLSYEDLNGGTFTITNGGIFGSMLSTPILNPPQSAILGMHAIKDRPIVEDGQIVIRPMIYLALSYDHRIIDGREAVSFLFTVKEVLEDPCRLLLDI
ncbi:MAG: 2-oxoglutarate dehydrogenase complex dihydrolipoyllysine-residue succinyltransferase [Methylococcaceae bacterium]